MEARAISLPGSKSQTYKTSFRAQSAAPRERVRRDPPSRGVRSGSASRSRAMARKESEESVVSGWEMNFMQSVSIDDKLKVSRTHKKPPSNARRKRMESLEKVKTHRPAQPISKVERQLLDRSQEALHMRNIMANAETMAGRDKQIFERSRKQQEVKNYDQRMHDLMERDRHAALQGQIRQDELNHLKSKERASIINQQLEDRQEQRLACADEVEYEKEEFRLKCRADEEAEVRKREAKRAVAKRMKAELVHSNKRAMRNKILKQQRDAKADAQILAYQKDKAYREQKADEEKAALKHANDLEHSKMMMAQERAIDLRGAQDEARMLAAFRDKEDQIWRQEKAKKKKKKKDIADLKAGWEKQKQQKAALIARQAHMDRWETTNQHEASYLAQQKLDDETDRLRTAAIDNRNEVQGQIEGKRGKRVKGARAVRDAVNGQWAIQQEKNVHIEMMRQENIKTMKTRGIPKKYWHKLDGENLGLAREITPSDKMTF